MKSVPIFVAAVVLLVSCSKVKPTGEVINRDIKIENFQKIQAGGNYRLFFVPSQSNFVNVETYQNVGDNLDISVENGTLTLKEKRPTSFVDFYNITVYGRQTPGAVLLKDSVEFNVSGRISPKKLVVEQSGYSKFIGAIQTEEFFHTLSGNSRASVLGKVGRTVLTTTDSANIISPYLETSVLRVKADKATYTELSVTDTLKGSISGGARFLYYGNPVRAVKIKEEARVNNKKSK